MNMLSITPNTNLTLHHCGMSGITFKDSDGYGSGYYLINIDRYGLNFAGCVSGKKYDVDDYGKLIVSGVDEI